MLRTQIFLPEDYYNQLQTLSQKRRISMGQIIRVFIKIGLQSKHNPFTEGNDLLSIANLRLSGGPKDLSTKINDYLY